MFSVKSLRVHLPAIILSVLFGVLVAGQFFVAADRLTGVFPGFANDQDFYLSRIQDFRDGATMSGNTYILEQKTAPPMNYLTGEGVEAFILNALDLPTQEALLLFPLLLTPIIFILTYAIFIQLRSPRFFALIATFALLFSHFATFARPISPQFNFIFWLLAIWGLIAMTSRPSWRSVVLESIAVGFLFYLYPYYWTHILAAFGILFVTYLFINRKSAWSFFGIALGGIAIGGGAILLLLENRFQPFYAESMTRLGFIATHFPSGLGLSALALASFIASLLLSRKNIYDWRFLATGGLVVGGVIAMNQHVITGINMEFSSHYVLQITFSAVFLIMAAIGAGGWWRLFEGKWLRGAVAILLLLAILPAIKSAYASADALSANTGRYKAYSGLVSWLKKNTSPEQVVYAPEETAIFIPAYTSDNVFYARNANIAFMSDAEVIDRFIIQHYRANFTEEFITSYERALFGHRYINRYNHALAEQKFLKIFGIAFELPERIPQAAITAIEKRASQLQSKPFESLISPYKIDYILIDSVHTDQPNENDLAFTKLLYTADSFKIYGVNAPLVH